MKHSIHRKVSKEHLGDEYYDVHRFLDQYMLKSKKYRLLFHHKEGLDFIEKLFGKKVRKAAEFHVKVDFGKIPTIKELGKIKINEIDWVSR